MEQRITEAAQNMFASTLIAYFGTISARLASDPGNRELIMEHRILGDELQRRIENTPASQNSL